MESKEAIKKQYFNIGQSTVETMGVIVAVLAAFVAMAVFFQKVIQGKQKQSLSSLLGDIASSNVTITKHEGRVEVHR